MDSPASEVPARRRFLRRLVIAGAVACAFALRVRIGGDQRPRIPARLAPADRAIAALAADFARADPARAQRIVRHVAQRLPGLERIRRPEQRVAAARAKLLAAARVDAELARAEVRLLGGWVLARSEAEFAIYAHAESSS